MDSINTLITKNFNDNINYLQAHHKELFNKLAAFDSAVENGHYQETYELVFEDDNFDVFEPSTQRYLYNKQLNKHTELSTASVNYNLDNSVFECFIRQDGKNSLPFASNIIQPIQKELKELTELKEINKFVFFGTALGIHIASIHQKIQAKHYLIIEDDLELFKLSLFCTNYKDISKTADITFAVFTEEDEFLQISENFLENQYHLNHYIKYFQLLSHSDNKYKKFYLTVTNQPHLRFLFHDLLSSYIKPLSYFSQHYQITNKSLKFTQESCPFLLIASGPSLETHIDWLIDNHKKFTLVCVSSSLSFLEKHNITPDIVFHTDPFLASTLSIDKLKSTKIIKDSIILLNSSVEKKFLNKFNKDNTYLFEMGSNYCTNSLKLSGPCVGSSALLLLILLRVPHIYLLGLDLAISSKTGANHISTHQEAITLNTNESNLTENLSYKTDLFQIKGNLDNYVLTTPHYFGSIQIINRYFLSLKQPSQTIYNLSNGAHFNLSLPMQTDMIDTAKYNKIEKKHLHQTFKTHSLTSLTNTDLKNLQLRLKEARIIYSNLDTYIYNDTLTAEKYIQDYLVLTNQYDKNQNNPNELSQILHSFSHYVLEYIYHALTHIEDSTKRHKIEQIFREQTQLLIASYINALENTIKEYNE